MPKAIPMALTFIFVNILLAILITAIGNDPMNNENVGNQGVLNSDLSTSSAENLTSTKADSWLGKYTTTIFNLPWWLQLLFYTFQVSFLGLTIYALIRGV